MSIQSTLVNGAMALMPRLTLPLTYARYRRNGLLEPEMAHLADWVRPGSVAVDVGANVGMVSYALCRLGATVEAFEPLPNCAKAIRTYPSPRLRVHNVALSSEDGELELHVPVTDGTPVWGRASLSNTFGPDEMLFRVPVKRLDEFDFQNVSFIKIDCEGHESKVLAGARETIARCRPVMLVEIEQRHLQVPMGQVFEAFLGQGYTGSFFRDGVEHPLSEFRFERDQKPYLDNPDFCPAYINDFLFRP